MSASPRRLGAGPDTPPAAPVRPRADWTADQWRTHHIRVTHDYERRIAALEDELEDYRMTLLTADQADRQARDEQFRALALYGGDRTLETVTQQVAVSPKFADLTTQEHAYVARVALATGLNPEFHIHAWISKKYNPQTRTKERVLNVTPDYKGLMALVARDRYLIKQRQMTSDELLARGVPERDVREGAIGYTVEAWDLAMKIRADQAGVEYEPVRGFGWWAACKDEEVWDKAAGKVVPTGKRIPNDVSHARDGAFEAWRRAMRALCYQIADLSIKFGGGIRVAGARIVDEDTYQFSADDGEAETMDTSGAAAAIEGEYAEAWDDFGAPPDQAPPAPKPAAALPAAPDDDEPATEAQIHELVTAFCQRAGMTIKDGRAFAAARMGVRTLYEYRGSAAALAATLEAWTPDEEV